MCAKRLEKYFDKEISMIVRGGLVKKWKQVTFYLILCEIQPRIIQTVKPKMELDQNKK